MWEEIKLIRIADKMEKFKVAVAKMRFNRLNKRIVNEVTDHHGILSPIRYHRLYQPKRRQFMKWLSIDYRITFCTKGNNEHCTTGCTLWFWIKRNQNSRCRLRVIKGDFSDEDKGSDSRITSIKNWHKRLDSKSISKENQTTNYFIRKQVYLQWKSR
jgi:DNA topoisomerase-3